MTRPEPQDVRVAAHEIGHFVTAPLYRLHLTDYGFKNSTGIWIYAIMSFRQRCTDLAKNFLVAA